MNDWTSNVAACLLDLCSVIPKWAYFCLRENICTTNEWAATVSNTRSQTSGFSIRCLMKEQKSSLSHINLQRKFWSRSSVGCCFGYHWKLTVGCLLVLSASGFAMILPFYSYGWGVCFLFLCQINNARGNTNLQWPTDIFISSLSSHTETQGTKNHFFSPIPLLEYFYGFWEGPARYSRTSWHLTQILLIQSGGRISFVSGRTATFRPKFWV